jgi:hypothetical protein
MDDKSSVPLELRISYQLSEIEKSKKIGETKLEAIFTKELVRNLFRKVYRDHCKIIR